MATIDEDTRYVIFAAWARGIGAASLARSYGLSRQEVQEVIDSEKQGHPLPLDMNPRELLEEHFIQLAAVIEELATAASRERGPVRIQAIVARFKAIFHRLELCQAIGVLPQTEEQLDLWSDGIRMANEMLDLLEEHGVLSDELLDAIADKFSANPRPPDAVDDET